MIAMLSFKSKEHGIVMAGLVPAIPFRKAMRP
jgi:hypothetical protein